jgi:hypothetical protein
MTSQGLEKAERPGTPQRLRIATFLFIVVLTGAMFSVGQSMVRHHFFDGCTQIQEYEQADANGNVPTP